MKLSIRYMGQSRNLAGVADEFVELADNGMPLDLLRELADRHGPPLRRQLLGDDAQRNPPALVFVNDDQVDWSTPPVLRNGDRITIVSPISGG